MGYFYDHQAQDWVREPEDEDTELDEELDEELEVEDDE
jgi:hypothetical protein